MHKVDLINTEIDFKKEKREKIIYFLICSFGVIASLTIILDFLYLRAISKFFQIFVLFVSSFLVFYNVSDTKKKNRSIIKLTVFILVYLVLFFIYDIITSKMPFGMISRSFLQIFFIYFWILIAFSLSHQLLEKILLFIQKLFYGGVIFAFFEIIIPSDLKISMLTFINGGEMPVSYLSRDIDFGFLRLGSFYLSPLSFSFTLLFLICYYKIYKNNKRNLFVFIMAILAQTKTAILGGLLIFFGKETKFVNKILLILILSLVLYICIAFDGWFFYYGFDGTSFKSLANHLSGLVFGVQEAFSNLGGNGLGKSGFLVEMDIIKNPVLANNFETLFPYERGNESSIGVIGYQLGGIFLILHFFLFLKIYFFQLKNKNYSIASFLLLVILFQLFTESSLTLLLSFCQAFLFAKGPVKDKSVKNIQNENSNC